MRESTIEKACGNRVRAYGGEWIKMHPLTVVGLPDRVAILPGGVVWFVELKADDGRKERLRPRQEWWEKRLRQMGCNYIRTNSMLEFVTALGLDGDE